ncbi:MAG: zinc dependent phospholipase C family protein [Eubacteriaceae bacterium]
MKLKSHIIIANMIVDILEKQIDIKVDRDSLELGAVYPDMNLPKRVRIHNLKQVYNNYNIQTRNFINKNKNRLGVSFSLGMLSHYVCDTFCLAHNMKMRNFNDFKRHVRYENALSDYLVHYKIGTNVIDDVVDNLMRCTEFDIYNFLGEYKKEYLQKANFEDYSNQFIQDIEYSIVCSTAVMLGFICELENAQCAAVEVLHV